jgi:hypothetical protein
MSRSLLILAVSLFLTSAIGCAMCDSSQDPTYAAHGGKWQRADPCCGRVGSLFAPAGVHVAEGPPDAAVDESVVAPGESESAEQQLPAPQEPPAPLEPSVDDPLSEFGSDLPLGEKPQPGTRRTPDDRPPAGDTELPSLEDLLRGS